MSETTPTYPAAPTPLATEGPAAEPISDAELADLRSKAELIELNHRNWMVAHAGYGCSVVEDEKGHEVCYESNARLAPEYIQFITTADPDTVLRLLAHTAALTTQLAEARAAAEKGEALAAVANGRNAAIIDGLPTHTNDLATFEGKHGFWCQADALFVEASSAHRAVAYYRQQASFGVSHNLHTDAIGRLRWQARAEKAERRLHEEEATTAAQEREKLELIRELLTAQKGGTTRMLTAEVLTQRYKIQSAECPDCGSPIALAGEFGCSCDVFALPGLSASAPLQGEGEGQTP